MPYARPTLSKLKAQALADIQSALPGTDPLLRFSNLGIIGTVNANMVNALYGYLDWIAKQSVPFTATDEFLYGWGALKNVIPIPAGYADNGGITFSGTQGKIIADQSSLSRSDGTAFTVQGEYTVGEDGTVTVSATADTAGIDGNTPIGSTFTLGVAISGIQSTGEVTVPFTNGVDAESVEDFRTRMLQVYQNPPQGGAEGDYVTWALNNTGGIVTRAWVNPNGFGAGTVVLYIMLDETESDFDGFPQGTDGCSTSETRGTIATGDQLIVADALHLLRPVTALLWVVSPLQNVVDFSISGLSSATTTVKDAVESAIKNVFVEQSTPLGDLVELSYIEAAIAAISGTEGFVIESPSANISSELGYIAVLGSISWV